MHRRIEQGARALLFERLVDDNPSQPGEVQPLRVLDREQLVASVRRELISLLNTRSTALEAPPHGWTVLEYGLRDFSAMQTRDEGARELLERSIADAIRRYEPRLKDPVVRVEARNDSERSLFVQIEGAVYYDHVATPVSFQVEAQKGNWKASNNAG